MPSRTCLCHKGSAKVPKSFLVAKGLERARNVELIQPSSCLVCNEGPVICNPSREGEEMKKTKDTEPANDCTEKKYSDLCSLY